MKCLLSSRTSCPWSGHIPLYPDRQGELVEQVKRALTTLDSFPPLLISLSDQDLQVGQLRVETILRAFCSSWDSNPFESEVPGMSPSFGGEDGGVANSSE